MHPKQSSVLSFQDKWQHVDHLSGDSPCLGRHSYEQFTRARATYLLAGDSCISATSINRIVTLETT